MSYSIGQSWKVVLLAVLSAAAAVLFEAVGLPAGPLLGPMIVAAVFAARGVEWRIPPQFFVAAQALVGLLIARSLNVAILQTVARQPALFLGATFTTLLASMTIGWGLTRYRVLPGATAIWGSMPGAATTMVLLAKDEGSDWQLVALMTYARVVLVALIASVLAGAVAGHIGSGPPSHVWFPRLDGKGLAQTIAIGAVGVWGGRLVGLPAAGLLGPMTLGAALEISGLAHPQLPGWLLALAYVLIGWQIGFGFTPTVRDAARRAVFRILAAVGVLILFCAICGVALAEVSGKDLVSCYLAMSPGGADSVAIIANAVPVDVAFVMGMQMLRFVAVLMIGVPLSRILVRRIARKKASRGPHYRSNESD